MEEKDAKIVVHKLQRARYSLAYIIGHYPDFEAVKLKAMSDQLKAVEDKIRPAKPVKEEKPKAEKKVKAKKGKKEEVPATEEDVEEANEDAADEAKAEEAEA